MLRTALAIAAALGATAASAQKPPPDAPPPEPPPSPAPFRDPLAPSVPRPRPSEPAAGSKPLAPGAVLEEVSGTVRAVDRKAHKLSVDTAGGTVTLSFDRNTMVYTPAGLGTVLDVNPGGQIRAGRNAEHLAYWVQVRAPAGKAEAPSTPGQGAGPAGGATAPATESSGTGAGPASPPSTPGGVTPVPTPGGVTPVPTPGGVTPVPTGGAGPGR